MVTKNFDRAHGRNPWIICCALIGSLLVAPCLSVQAQQPAKVPRIGYLSGGSRSSIAARVEAFRRGLRELGYVEGKDIIIGVSR